MSEYNGHVGEFLEKVMSHIKYRSIHKTIEDELLVHIEEQKAEYIKRGIDEKNAAVKAIEQMGDPDVVGKQLNKAHSPRTEWSILIITFVIVILGGAVQFFLSGEGIRNENLFFKYLFYAPIGILVFSCVYFFDYTLLGRHPKLVVCILLGAALVGFNVLERINGTFYHVYYISLLAIPVFGIVVYSLRGKGYLGIVASGAFYAAIAFLCIIGPRIYALGLFSLACIVIITVAILKGYFNCNKRVGIAIVYIPTILFVSLLTYYLIMSSPRRLIRILTIFVPEIDPNGGGWQHMMVRSLIKGSKSIGEAVLYGNLSNTQINQVLPSWDSNFALTYIIARLGYIAGLVIISVLSILIIRMFITILKQKNALGFLLSFSAFIAISGQFMLYILSNFGVVMTSVTLPFISYGGSTFVLNMMLLGLVMSVYRRSHIVDDKLQKGSVNNYKLVTIEDGRIIIDFGIRKLKRTHK
ncbi:FtsW/RodA/SpoVE family cell cycle protein [Pseudobacteroides cellulosolvens]|uniref:Cell cycle protein n=1 Tax=Pseudobacteroides cellulosolvens ATCC 35603 = DSM 2933 TaxID=398512 RepID=A0A0L6JIM8_9FIRM|nr:FtsW/RodA/SpoVE family cell cycle protein [Pseudobacteroides cellulosolvens]KNY25307.1 cell cycle protein [Pseudobacteroides cellulosolvens ATCC 35603 = DSM 2933]